MFYLIEIKGTDFLHSLTKYNNNRIERFIQTVENNKFSKLTLKELSFLCGMSISAFRREFEKYYSESPIKWFQNKRLEQAHYLLNQKQKILPKFILKLVMQIYQTSFRLINLSMDLPLSRIIKNELLLIFFEQFSKFVYSY